MAQVLIIGKGRLATHLQSVFQYRQISHTQWHRGLPEDQLIGLLRQAQFVWLAISDSAIAPFFKTWQSFGRGHWVHSSGALVVPGVLDLHPLMSFSTQRFSADEYQKIAWVTSSEDLSAFAKLTESLQLKLYRIKPEQKAEYHAWCVLAGNGAVLLWQNFMNKMNQLGIESELARSYYQQITRNLDLNIQQALTGPWVRNDQMTIQSNLAALTDSPWQEVMSALIRAYREGKNAHRP